MLTDYIRLRYRAAISSTAGVARVARTAGVGVSGLGQELNVFFLQYALEILQGYQRPWTAALQHR